MTNTNAESPDISKLGSQLIQSQFMYLRLATVMLDANPFVAGWSRKTIELVIDYRRLGWKIVLEIAATGASGAAAIAMVAVSHDGERRELDRLEEISPHGAN